MFCTRLLAVLALTMVCSVSLASDQRHADDVPSDEELLKMKVKDLRALLAKKGVQAECVACTSKRELVERIRETREWDDVAAPTEGASAPHGDDEEQLDMETLSKMFEQSRNDAQVDDVIKKLREAGIDTSNVMTSDDLLTKLRANDASVGGGAARDEL